MSQPSLDPLALEWIFGRLAVRYGDRWRAKWEGMPMDAVKADWATQLAHCRRESLMYAMEHLPVDFPPTVGQFLESTRRAPAPGQPRISDDVTRYEDPQRMRQFMTKLADGIRNKTPLAWAYALQEREKRGDDLSTMQQAAWRWALDRRQTVGDAMTSFGSIDPACLPPGMRPKSPSVEDWRHEIEREGAQA